MSCDAWRFNCRSNGPSRCSCFTLFTTILKERLPILVGLIKQNFAKKVTPGDTLILEVEILKIKANAGLGKGIARVDGKKVAEAELTFMIG